MTTPHPRSRFLELLWYLNRYSIFYSIPAAIAATALAAGLRTIWIDYSQKYTGRWELVEFGVLLWLVTRCISGQLFLCSGSPTTRIFIHTLLIATCAWVVYAFLAIYVKTPFWHQAWILLTPVSISMIILGTYKTFFEKERNAPLKLIMKWAVASQTGFLVFVWLSGVTVAFSMWLAGKSSTSHGSVLAGLPSVAFDGFGYPLIKIILLKFLARSPAWKHRVVNRAEARKTMITDMTFVILYESFFGVAGRMLILRLRNHAVFSAACSASLIVDFVRRVAEAALLKKELDAKGLVRGNKGWDMEEGCEHKQMGGEEQKGGVTVEETVITKSAALGDDAVKHLSEQAEPKTRSEKVSTTTSPGTTTQSPKSQSQLSVIFDSYAARRTTELTADWITRTCSFTICSLFISGLPESYTSCHGYIPWNWALVRGLTVIPFAILSNIASLYWEERILGIRYTELRKDLPRLPVLVHVCVVMQILAGCLGPLIAVDAGLFEPTACFGGKGK